MQIEAGKYYRTRDGQKVGPMRRNGNAAWPWEGYSMDGDRWTFTDEGRQAADPTYESRADLIAEWTDTPEPAKVGLPDWAGFHDVDDNDVEVRIADSLVCLAVEIEGRMASSMFTPKRARDLAAALIAYADQAEAQQ